MISPHLQSEQQRLRDQISAITSSGPIAPPNVRIEADFLNHKCWRLTHTTLPVRERELGVAIPSNLTAKSTELTTLASAISAW